MALQRATLALRSSVVQVSARDQSPGDSEDVFVQPPDLLAAVEQQAAGSFRVLVQETTQASRPGGVISRVSTRR